MEHSEQHKVIKICVTICRFVLAGVFVFSGFVKTIDPMGTYYKILDYVEALGLMDVLPQFILSMTSFMLGMVEFCLGVYLFFGIRRIITPYLSVLIMCVMTPLTLWIAIFNPVSDCGCFGDAVTLSNWETFGKNVVLLIMSLVLLKWRKHITPLVSVRLDWLIAIYGFVYIFFVGGYCYRYLPIFDFRPYHVGADIAQGMIVPAGEQPTVYESRFILRKDGEEKEFTLEDYPDSTWTFVDSKTIITEKGYEPPIQDFSILSMADGEDITEAILSDENYTFLLVAHQLNLADDGSIDLINELYDYSLEYGYNFYCLTSSSQEDIELWKENTGAEYPFCFVDNITLKTMIRSNPGLMLLKKGVVYQKWSVRNLPDEYELLGPLEILPIGSYDKESLFYKIIWAFSWFFFPLFLISMLDLLYKRYYKRNHNLKNEYE